MRSLHIRAPWLNAALMLVILAALALPAAAVLAEEPGAAQRMEDSRSRYSLGRMYEQAGDLTRAEQYYQQAIELWPENQEARTALQQLIDARKPAAPTQPFWTKWFNLGQRGTFLLAILEGIGWVLLALIFAAVIAKLMLETVRLAILRAKGIPLLGLGQFRDPTARVPGLPHYLAALMNDAGLKIYDEKGAVLPDFNFIGESGFAQARMVARMLEILNARQVQRINVEVTPDDGLLAASVSLVDTAHGYVRYLQVVQVDPRRYGGAGELPRVVARLVADAILIALSRDPNTRGLLHQRMGDWSAALKEFIAAAESARRRGICGSYYQAHLNLGNLYSFLGLQDKSIDAYTEVAERAQHPVTLALIHAAMACSYKNWQEASPPDQQGRYEWLARQAIEKALASQQKSALVAYTIACYYSLSNQIDECLRWLREAVAGDLAYLDYAMTDPDMEQLRRWLDGRPLGEALGLRV